MIRSYWPGRAPYAGRPRSPRRAVRNADSGGRIMTKWKTPKIVEIACGMEINCYASAKR